MALGTTNGDPHEDLSGRINTVFDRSRSELFVVGAPFGVRHGIPVECRSNALTERGVRKQIACNLLCGELVVGFIGIKGIDDPVSITPHVGAEWIGTVTRTVSVASQVKPGSRPALSKGGIGQEPVNHFFIRSRGLVSFEPSDFFG